MPLTYCAAFSQAPVKAVTIRSVLLRCLHFGGLQQLDRWTDRQLWPW